VALRLLNSGFFSFVQFRRLRKLARTSRATLLPSV
jgi:hypothetical protein